MNTQDIREFTGLILNFFQVVSTIVGILVVYFKIAKRIGHFEASQAQNTKAIEEARNEQKEASKELQGLAKLVHELFGQLKKTPTTRR